jgi:hypothetical protein
MQNARDTGLWRVPLTSHRKAWEVRENLVVSQFLLTAPKKVTREAVRLKMKLQ